MNRPEGAPLYAENRVSRIICYVIITVFVLRKLLFLWGEAGFLPAVTIIAVYLGLYISLPYIARRWPIYTHLNFAIQFCLILALGWIKPYEDTWSFLCLTTVIQVRRFYSRSIFVVLVSTITLIVTLTLMVTHGWLIGLCYGILIIAASFLFLAADMVLTQTEAARQESEHLLADLRAAHERLQEYAEQVEEITASQERDRMTRELHDAISQLLFSITLLAQSTRLLVDKNPSQVPKQLEQLQELTGRALTQMRSLISQWKPG
jgi:signal transduction histidine kinase